MQLISTFVFFLPSNLDLKRQMPFLSPPHVPALFIYPTTQGIFIFIWFIKMFLYFNLYVYNVLYAVLC